MSLVVSRLLGVPAGPQLRIKTRGEARSDVPGLRPVPGCEPGPAGDGYRFTGYSTTSSSSSSAERLSVSYGGSRDQAGLLDSGATAGQEESQFLDFLLNI